MGRILRWLGTAVAVVLVAIQLVPYGRDHRNPPVTQEPRWDRPETRALAMRACFDCHSNETVWPWYTYVAPVFFAVPHTPTTATSPLRATRVTDVSLAGSDGASFAVCCQPRAPRSKM